MKINYSVKGSGPILILLHGWGGSSKSLGPLQNELVHKGFQIYNLDLPGFGKSEVVKKVMGLHDYVESLLQFIEKLNLFKPVLVGHSFGGKVALAFAAKYGTKLSRLVVIDASGINPQNHPKKEALHKPTKFFGKVFDLPGLKLAKPLARKIFYKTIVRESDYLKAGKLKETFKKVVNEHLDSELKKITNDTLVIWGEKDNITPLWQGEKLAKNITHARLEVIEGAKHGLPLVRPDLVADLIYLYLSK